MPYISWHKPAANLCVSSSLIHMQLKSRFGSKMKLQYLCLIPFFLVSCGSSETKPPVKASLETTKAAQFTPVSSEKTPLEHGAKVYKKCKTCHTLEEGGRHRVGPNLWDIYGSRAGSKDGFKYSKVMAASEVIWDAETIDAYITKPSSFMKGNRMSFIGIKKQADRDAVQLYIKSKTTPK